MRKLRHGGRWEGGMVWAKTCEVHGKFCYSTSVLLGAVSWSIFCPCSLYHLFTRKLFKNAIVILLASSNVIGNAPRYPSIDSTWRFVSANFSTSSTHLFHITACNCDHLGRCVGIGRRSQSSREGCLAMRRSTVLLFAPKSTQWPMIEPFDQFCFLSILRGMLRWAK